MTINFTDLFTKLGKFFFAAETLVADASTFENEVEDAVQGVTSSDPIDEYNAIREAPAGADILKNAVQGALATALTVPASQLLIEIVDADKPLPNKNLVNALKELISQMEDNSESVDATTPGATPSYGASNTGDGVIVTSTKRGDGKVNEHIVAETIELVFGSGTTFNYSGEEAAPGKLHPDWPEGSGASGTLSSYIASSSANRLAGTFETEDDNASELPSGWIASTVTLGTTLKMTDVEVQTVIISGTPTSGYYILHFTDKDGNQQDTAPLVYNAASSAVQTALRNLTGLDDITVAESGSTPNFTHTVTFTGVTNPGELTSTNALDTGSISHATTTDASANVVRGARALEFDANGSEQTSIEYPVTLTSATPYAFHVLMKVDSVPAAGVFTVDLIDGIGGSVIQDDEGTSNSFTIDATALTTSFASKTGVFRTPTNLPDNVYLRFRQSTAVSNTTSVFVDEMSLVAMTELYRSGLWAAAFDGATRWDEDDEASIAVTSDRAGKFHEWFNRTFDLDRKQLLLPTDTSGSDGTIDDSLIA